MVVGHDQCQPAFSDSLEQWVSRLQRRELGQEAALHLAFEGFGEDGHTWALVAASISGASVGRRRVTTAPPHSSLHRRSAAWASDEARQKVLRRSSPTGPLADALRILGVADGQATALELG